MKIARLVFALAALAFGSTGWGQSLYPLFGPSSGIMKGDPTTPATTSAAAADVYGLFGCTLSTQFLNGTGGCTVPAGVTPSGAANLVFATPNGGSGSASLRALVGADLPPINLASTANGGVLSTSILLGTNGGTSNGFFSITGPATSLKTFTFPNASATVLTTNAAVTVAQGGTGAATLAGLLKGNGTSAFTAAASSDVIGLWTGTCTPSNSIFLATDGTCAAGGSGSVANPTGTIGLTAVNGAAASAIRSDGAPALSQAIIPVWTGKHIFDGGGNTTLSLGVGDSTHYGTETVGLGTFNANPTAGDPPHIFDVINSDATMQGLRISSYGVGAVSSVLHFVHMRGTITAPTALQSGDNFLSIGARGYDTAPTGSAIAIEGVTTENWSSGHNGSELQFQVTPTATSTASRANVLRLNGQNAIFQNVVGNPAINTGVTIAGRSSLPALYIINNGNSVDQRLVEFLQGSGFALSFNNDANTSNSPILTATRGTANAVSTVNIGNATDSPNVSINGKSITNNTTFTLSVVSGCTTTPNVTAFYYVAGNVAFVYAPTLSCTSNAGTFVLGGFPAAIQPAGGVTRQSSTVGAFDGTGAATAEIQVCNSASSGCTAGQASAIPNNAVGNTWTSSGTKGVSGAFTFPLQ